MDSKALASLLPFSSSSSHRQFSGKDGKVALKNPSCDVESTPLPLLTALGKKKISFRCPPVRRGGISFSSRHIFWHESTLILPFLSSQVRGDFSFKTTWPNVALAFPFFLSSFVVQSTVLWNFCALVAFLRKHKMPLSWKRRRPRSPRRGEA